LQERLHRDRLEPNAVDRAERGSLGARVVRDRDGGTRQRREGDDAADQRERSRRRDE
jgi:hypothetical protein